MVNIQSYPEQNKLNKNIVQISRIFLPKFLNQDEHLPGIKPINLFGLTYDHNVIMIKHHNVKGC